MIAILGIAGSKPRAPQPEASRIRYKAFSWWTMLSFPTREPARPPGVHQGWRTLLLDAKP